MAISPEELQKNFVTIGGLRQQNNPKTRSYQEKQEAGLVCFDPKKIALQLERAKKRITEAQKSNKNILLVSEKVLYKEDVLMYAKKHGFHYMAEKMPAGFLTNFTTLQKRIEYMNKQRSFVKSDAYKHLTKKEQIAERRKLNKIERVYEGVAKLKDRPDMVIIIDGMQLEGLMNEVSITNTDNIVMVGSSFNKWRNAESLVTMNLQSLRSMQFVLSYLFG